MYSEKKIGEIIRQLRGDLSLREFALKCEISHTTIDNLEKGIDFRTGKPTQVKMTTLQKIADACDVPVSYIIGEEEPSSQVDALKLALFGGGVEVTDDMWQEVISFANYVKEKHKKGDSK